MTQTISTYGMGHAAQDLKGEVQILARVLDSNSSSLASLTAGSLADVNRLAEQASRCKEAIGALDGLCQVGAACVVEHVCCCNLSVLSVDIVVSVGGGGGIVVVVCHWSSLLSLVAADCLFKSHTDEAHGMYVLPIDFRFDAVEQDSRLFSGAAALVRKTTLRTTNFSPLQAEDFLNSSQSLLAKNEYVQAADAVASAEVLLGDLQRAESASANRGGRGGVGVDKENRRNGSGAGEISMFLVEKTRIRRKFGTGLCLGYI